MTVGQGGPRAHESDLTLGTGPDTTSAPPQTPAMQRRLWFLYPLVLGSVSTIWGGTLQTLLARQITASASRTSGPRPSSASC